MRWPVPTPKMFPRGPSVLLFEAYFHMASINCMQVVSLVNEAAMKAFPAMRK